MGDDLDAALAAIARQLHWSAGQTAELHRHVVRLVETIAEDSHVSPLERRRRRQERLTALKSMQTALQRPRKVADRLRPRAISEVGDVLSAPVGEFFSSGAFRRAGAVIGYGLSERQIKVALGRRQPENILGPEFEADATFQRQVAARRRCMDVVFLVLDRLAAELQRELAREALEAPDGRPHDRPRLIALAGLWNAYSRLTGSPVLPKTPPRAYLDLCAAILPAIGIDTVGMEEAAERLFSRPRPRARKSRV